jgi:5'(3')-deoxyribonucleotidase
VRLGIDLDGVVADFNAGWMRLHADEHGTELTPDLVTGWDDLHEVGGFRSMGEFWWWARGGDRRPSIFRHLDPYPGAVETLEGLARAGHQVVILTSKPWWAIHDTYHWIAEHGLPTREIHMLEDKWQVSCDVYLDDSPKVLPSLAAKRPSAVVCRFVRAWNEPVAGTTDVHDWPGFARLVDDLSS